MRKGPKQQRRSAGVIETTVKVMPVAIQGDYKDPAAKSLGSRGGKARAKSLTKGQRTAIAKKAAEARWRG